jgi:PAS domain S-box-containing protein
VARGEPVRRRQAGVLVVGAAEPEIQSWLRAAGHLPRAVRRASAAGAALAAEPVDLVIVDRDSSGKDAPEVCRVLRDDSRLGDAWVLAITVAAKGRMADAVLNAGADDYLHRPFTRAELIARTRAGLRAAQERSNDRLLRSLMENVPGAIYRSAWHADHQLEMITDEIERISGYPPQNFIASTRRTILTLIHPEDLDTVVEAIARSSAANDEPFELEYRIVRADGEVRWVLDRGQLVAGPGGRLWLDGAIFDITERKGAEEAALRHQVEAARTAELRASRARIIEAADKARRKIERDLHDASRWPSGASRRTRPTSARSSRSSAGTSWTRPPSCASSPAASTRPCSPNAASRRRSERSRRAASSRSRSSTSWGSGCRPRSRRRPTSPSPRR